MRILLLMTTKKSKSIEDNTHTVSVRKSPHSNFPQSAGLACDYADLVHHHNERAKAPGPAQKTEPTEEPDYDCEGLIPHN